MEDFVAIDSNALTYLVEAMKPGYEPARDVPGLATERIAIMRAYLYGGIQFWVMPTVEAEYNQIHDRSRHLDHQQAAWVLLHDAPLNVPSKSLYIRASQLAAYHAGANDCRIVAEAEASGVLSLITRDDDLIGALQSHTKLLLQYPSTLWESLGIAPGAKPVREPSPSNPLGRASWWRL